MIYNNNIQYQLDTHLEVRHLANSVQESCFSAEYTLKPIKAQTLPFGERNGMNLYEISIPNFIMSLDKSLVKSSDFLQRCAYRYDGVQIHIGNTNIIRILNKETLREQWDTICSLLHSDYKGFFVEDYLMRINSIMESSEEHNKTINNYFYFGLILFGIPHETAIGWSRIRKVMLSDFDDIIFEERLFHEQDMDDKRCFSIVGENINESTNCRINKYYGRAQIPMNSFFPDWTQLEIDYTKEDINVYWKYELTKQVEQ